MARFTDTARSFSQSYKIQKILDFDADKPPYVCMHNLIFYNRYVSRCTYAIYLHIARKTDTPLANKKTRINKYIVYTYAVYIWIWYDFIYIYWYRHIIYIYIQAQIQWYKKYVPYQSMSPFCTFFVEVNILCLQPFGVELVSRSVHVITLWCGVRFWKSWEHW